MAVTNDVPTVPARLRMGIGISAGVIEPAWYVDISNLETRTILADAFFYEKVECKGGRWTEVKDCGRNSCHGTNDGAAVC